MDAPASVHAAYARARQMYVDGLPVKEICAAVGLKPGQVYFALEGGPVAATGERMFAAIERNRTGRREPQAEPRRSRRIAVVAKLWESAERQVADIHARVLAAGLDSDERERDGRMLAVLVKTLRELAALDTTMAGHDERTDDEPDTRDIDEFRRELTRRIDALVAARDRDAAGGAAGA